MYNIETLHTEKEYERKKWRKILFEIKKKSPNSDYKCKSGIPVLICKI